MSPAESEQDDMVGGEQRDEPEAAHRRVLGGDPGGGEGGEIKLPGWRKTDDFIIIDSDLKEQSNSVNNIIIPTRSLPRKHFLSSPYKVY